LKFDAKFFAGTGVSAEALLKFHPIADRMPMMGDDAFDLLVNDIHENDLQQPIDLYEGQILDGRNRYLACLIAGRKPKFREFDGLDPVAYVYSVNVHRRHLTLEQKRNLAAELLAESPERSDRAIAKLTQLHHKTVQRIRDELDERGALRHVEARVDSKGRVYPAHKEKKTRSSTAPLTAMYEAEEPESDGVAGCVSAVRHGDILRNLNEFVRSLNPDKERITSYPAAARAALSRKVLELFGVSLDELRPICAVPVFKDGFCLGAHPEGEPAKALEPETDMTAVVAAIVGG
jgi:DNA-binding Lrp family transcriptional regulator